MSNILYIFNILPKQDRNLFPSKGQKQKKKYVDTVLSC